LTISGLILNEAWRNLAVSPVFYPTEMKLLRRNFLHLVAGAAAQNANGSENIRKNASVDKKS
jgi:hypothetical protein